MSSRKADGQHSGEAQHDAAALHHRARTFHTPGIARFRGFKMARKRTAVATAAIVSTRKNCECGHTVQYFPMTVSFPPSEMLKNHAPINTPRSRGGATFETSDSPIG